MVSESKDYPFEFEYALLLDQSGVNVAQQIGQRIRDLAAGGPNNPTPGQPPTSPAGETSAEGGSQSERAPPTAEKPPEKSETERENAAR